MNIGKPVRVYEAPEPVIAPPFTRPEREPMVVPAREPVKVGHEAM